MKQPDAEWVWDKRLRRQKEALQLRMAGATYREIAEQQQRNVADVHKDVQKAMRDIPKEEADALRKQERDRLDKLQFALWDSAISGDVHASQQVLKIIDRRAKLLGLDAPQQVEVSASDVDLDATVARILQAAEIAHRGDEGA